MEWRTGLLDDRGLVGPRP